MFIRIVFGESSFIGKGIYGVEQLSSVALRGRFPDNQHPQPRLDRRLLCAVSGLLSDVELYEESSSRYSYAECTCRGVSRAGFAAIGNVRWGAGCCRRARVGVA